jgi:hypothetical protein
MSAHTTFHCGKLLGFTGVNVTGRLRILEKPDDFTMSLLVICLALCYAGINAPFGTSHPLDTGTLGCYLLRDLLALR